MRLRLYGIAAAFGLHSSYLFNVLGISMCFTLTVNVNTWRLYMLQVIIIMHSIEQIDAEDLLEHRTSLKNTNNNIHFIVFDLPYAFLTKQKKCPFKQLITASWD